jgi:hypothetical protein
MTSLSNDNSDRSIHEAAVPQQCMRAGTLGFDQRVACLALEQKPGTVGARLEAAAHRVDAWASRQPPQEMRRFE